MQHCKIFTLQKKKKEYCLLSPYLLFLYDAKAPPKQPFPVERQPIVHLCPPYAGSCISPCGSCTCNYLVFTTTEFTESYVGKEMG